MGLIFFNGVATGFSNVLQQALQTATSAKSTPVEPASFLLQRVQQLFFITALFLLVLLPVILFTLWMTRRQKRGGQSAIPLPPKIPAVGDNLLVGILCIFIVIPLCIAIVRAGGFTFAEIQTHPAHAAHRVISTFFWLGFATGAVSVVLGILQLSLYKIRLLKHLSLTTTEQKKEQRLHGHSQTRNNLLPHAE